MVTLEGVTASCMYFYSFQQRWQHVDRRRSLIGQKSSHFPFESDAPTQSGSAGTSPADLGGSGHTPEPGVDSAHSHGFPDVWEVKHCFWYTGNISKCFWYFFCQFVVRRRCSAGVAGSTKRTILKMDRMKEPKTGGRLRFAESPCGCTETRKR